MIKAQVAISGLDPVIPAGMTVECVLPCVRIRPVVTIPFRHAS